MDVFSLSYRYLPFLVDFFYIFTYFVWWGDFIFRRLLNSVWLLTVKWENKKTSHPKLGQHVCCHLCLLHMGYILVFWVQATFWERWCRHIFRGGWREGVEAECIYHWHIEQTCYFYARLPNHWIQIVIERLGLFNRVKRGWKNVSMQAW